MKADTELLGPATHLRTTLVSQGILLLEEAGPDAVTFRELGRRASASHSAPLVHFGDRTGLLAAMAARGFGLLLERLREVPAEGAGRDRLEALARAYVGFALERMALHRVMHAPELWAAVEEQELPLDSPAAGRKGQVAAWIDRVLGSGGEKGETHQVREEVRGLCARFPMPGHVAGAAIRR